MKLKKTSLIDITKALIEIHGCRIMYGKESPYKDQATKFKCVYINTETQYITDYFKKYFKNRKDECNILIQVFNNTIYTVESYTSGSLIFHYSLLFLNG